MQFGYSFSLFIILIRTSYLLTIRPTLLEKRLCQNSLLGFKLHCTEILKKSTNHPWLVLKGFLHLSRSQRVDFIFIFFLLFSFSIFRTTKVRVRSDWSYCHISHNLGMMSQDKSQDIGEFSRRF